MSSHRVLGPIVLTFSLALSAGCTTSSDSAVILGSGLDGPVVRHQEPIGDGGEDAEVGGTLILEGDCLYLGPVAGSGDRYPVVWPAGTGWGAGTTSVVLPSGERVGLGEAVVGGGGAHFLSSVTSAAGDEAAQLVESCLDNTTGEITLVNNSPDAIRKR